MGAEKTVDQLVQIVMNRTDQLRLRCREQELIFLVPLTLLIIIKNMLYLCWLLFFGRGLPQSDDGQWYIDYAGTFLANLRDGLDINDVLYFGYNALLSILMAIFRDPVAVVVLQGITAGLGVILVYKIAVMLFNRRTAVIASIFYACIFEFTRWSLYILSDSFFVSLLLLCIYFLLMAMDTREGRYRYLFLLLSFYLAIFRPTGIVILAFMAVSVLLQLNRKTLLEFISRYYRWLAMLLVLLVSVVVYLYINNKMTLFFHSVQFEMEKILLDVYGKGWVYDKSTPFDHDYWPDYAITVKDSVILSFILNNWENISILCAKRAVAFLGTWVWAADFKSVLGILGALFNLVPAGLFFIGVASAIKNGLFKRASVIWMPIIAVYLFCVVIFIDAMYRYQYPALPFIAIIAAYGTERLLNKAKIIMKYF